MNHLQVGHLQIDHLQMSRLQVDHLDPNLQFSDVVNNLYSTDPTQETRYTVVEHADCYGSHPAR